MPPDKAKVLATYLQLLAKVEEKFAEIQSRQARQMKCAKGCHSCCVPSLTVFEIERENLRRFIESTPGLAAELKELETENPHKSTRCSFLKIDGNCAVYSARPLVCRSHGAPLFFKDDVGSRTDVCPLNFSELSDLKSLESQDFINLDLLNTILAQLNRELDPSGERTPLKVDDLLK